LFIPVCGALCCPPCIGKHLIAYDTPSHTAEVPMGLATGLLICVVIALVLYWAVPLCWSFTRPWGHARSLKDPIAAHRRSSTQPKKARGQRAPHRRRRPF